MKLSTQRLVSFSLIVTLLEFGLIAQLPPFDARDVFAATFTVSNLNDSGAGSLRQAITDAEASPGADLISFSVAGTITLATPLPGMNEDVVLDATTTTQAGPNIKIDNTANPASPGLQFLAGDNIAVYGIWVSGGSNCFEVNTGSIGVELGSDLSAEHEIFSDSCTNGIYASTGTDDITIKQYSTSAAAPNTSAGIYLDGVTNVTIGGNTSSERNVISGNVEYGIYATNVGGLTIQGNYIGTNAAGTAAVPNSTTPQANSAGITIESGNTSVLIGGGAAGEGNLISGNDYDGVRVFSDGVTLYGNMIGLNAAGTGDLGNVGNGVVFDSSNNVMGGSTALQRNVVSGNTGRGIVVGDSGVYTNNTIENNYVGTSSDGLSALGNDEFGIWIKNTTTSSSILDNVVSGNGSSGVFIDGSNHTIEGNIIGMGVDGTTDLGNVQFGLNVQGTGHTIGQAGCASCVNVLSGNGDSGLHLNGASSVVVENNYIGVDGTGSAYDADSLNSNFSAVYIEGGAASNTIGGTTAAAGNVIAHTSGSGVFPINLATDAGDFNLLRYNTYLSMTLGEAVIEAVAPSNEGLADAIITSAIQTAPTETTIIGTTFANAIVDYYVDGEMVASDIADGAGNFTEAVPTFGALATVVTTNGSNSTAGSPVALAITAGAFPPVVTDGEISASITTDGGTASIADIDDVITVVWDNSVTGDNNAGLTAVTANLTAFGGGAAVAMTDTVACGGTNGDNVYEVCYTIVAGSVDAANLNASVTATNVNGPTTTSDTSNLSVDSQAPTVTNGEITASITTDAGTIGVAEITDVVTYVWDNSGTGDNNADESTVTIDLSAFGGGAAVAMTDTTACGGTNGDNVYETCFTISGASINGTHNASITVTDDASNSTTTADTSNVVVNAVDITDPAAPTLVYVGTAVYTDGATISVTGEVGTSIYVDGVDSGVNIDGDGTTDVDVVLVLGANAIDITLVDDASNESAATVANITGTAPEEDEEEEEGGGGSGGVPIPSDSSDPTDPTDPSDSSDPTDPADPSDPTDPADPSDPTDPTDPTDPADPSDPTDPSDSSDPSDPTGPSDSSDPSDPSVPVVPTVPQYWINTGTSSPINGGAPVTPGTQGDAVVRVADVMDSLMENRPEEADADADGLNYLEELTNGTCYMSKDTDEDGYSDYYEVVTLKTNPDNYDSDGDGLSDFVDEDPVEYELPTERFGQDEIDAFIAEYSLMEPLGLIDTDLDGLADLYELYVGSNPRLMDTDGDGFSDGDEIHHFGFDPTFKNAKEKCVIARLTNLKDGDKLTPNAQVFLGGAPSSMATRLYFIDEEGSLVPVSEGATDEKGRLRLFLADSLEPGDYSFILVMGTLSAPYSVSRVYHAEVVEDEFPVFIEQVDSLSLVDGVPSFQLKALEKAKIVVSWRSSVFTQTFIADTSGVVVDVQNLSMLEPGPHTVVWQAVNLETQEKSEAFSLSFDIPELAFISVRSNAQLIRLTLIGFGALAGAFLVWRVTRRKIKA